MTEDRYVDFRDEPVQYALYVTRDESRFLRMAASLAQRTETVKGDELLRDSAVAVAAKLDRIVNRP